MSQSNNASKSKRIFYYDVLRAIAIIGIIFCHVSNSYVSRDINSSSLYISAFFDCFRDFSIPIFVMLSGALLIGKKDSLQNFFKKRLSRLFIPFLFWVLVYIIFTSMMVNHGFNPDKCHKNLSWNWRNLRRPLLVRMDDYNSLYRNLHNK